MTPAWDALFDAFEHAIAHSGTDIDELTRLVRAAIDDGTVDAELNPAETARLLTALAIGTHQIGATESDLATARLVATRWLHPARLATRLESGPPI